jgi:hypothetical protein
MHAFAYKTVPERLADLVPRWPIHCGGRKLKVDNFGGHSRSVSVPISDDSFPPYDDPMATWKRFLHQHADVLVLAGVCLAFFFLWLPNLRYPLVTDPVGYAHLSKSFWETGTYQIRGQPDDVFVPMHPIVSYGFIVLFGMSIGMKVATLVYGMIMAATIFVCCRRLVPEDLGIARITVGLLVVSFPTTWLLSTGNADMLYGLLFFLCLLVYQKAEHHPRLYWLLGVLMGVTLLTRYMGIALLCIVGTHALLARRAHLKYPAFWAQFFIAVAIFSLWFIRHKLTFGVWFSTFHVRFQLEDPTPVWLRVARHIWFYFQPFHSLCFLYPFFLYGLWHNAKRYLLFTIAVPLSLILCYAYPSATSRFLIATIPLLLFFAALGIRRAYQKFPPVIISILLALAIVFQILLTVLYTLPQANAWLDRRGVLPFIPQNLSVSQEGAESLQQALDWVNTHGESGATVISSLMLREDIPVWYSSRRVRNDLQLDVVPSCNHVTYDLVETNVHLSDGVLFITTNQPPAMVRAIAAADCRMPLGRDPEARYW